MGLAERLLLIDNSKHHHVAEGLLFVLLLLEYSVLTYINIPDFHHNVLWHILFQLLSLSYLCTDFLCLQV